MKKKNTDVTNDNPIIVNWVQSNEDKLAEVKTVNPDLFSAMTSALTYLNNYLGGQSPIQISESVKKPKQIESQGITESVSKEYQFPFYQWRLQTISELENWVEDYFTSSDLKRDYAKIQGQPLTAIIEFVGDIFGLIDNRRKADYSVYVKSANIFVSGEQITDDYLPLKNNTVRDTNRILLDSLIKFYNKYTYEFNNIYSSYASAQSCALAFIESPDSSATVVEDIVNCTLNEAERRYLFLASSVAWWVFNWIRAYDKKQELSGLIFRDSENNSFFVNKVQQGIKSPSDMTLVTLKDDNNNEEEFSLERNDLTKCLLGLSFNIYSQKDFSRKEVQVNALPQFENLPFKIGDNVELIDPTGYSAELGAKAKVMGVEIWQYFSQNTKPFLMINVLWLDTSTSKNQSNGSYEAHIFRNISRPTKLVLVPTETETTAQAPEQEWRVKTEAEMIRDFGKKWRQKTSWITEGNDMDYLFGQPLKDVVKPESLDNFLQSEDTRYGTLEMIKGWAISPNQVTKDPLPTAEEVKPSSAVQKEKFDVTRKEAFKFRAGTPEESYAFQAYVYSKGVKNMKSLSEDTQIIDDKQRDFLVENGILLYLSAYSFQTSTAEQVSLTTLGITVKDFPKPEPVKKERKPRAKAPKIKEDVQNLYNELDDLDI